MSRKPPRVVRLEDLTPEQRRLVLALVEAGRAAEVAKSLDNIPNARAKLAESRK